MGKAKFHQYIIYRIKSDISFVFLKFLHSIKIKYKYLLHNKLYTFLLLLFLLLLFISNKNIFNIFFPLFITILLIIIQDYYQKVVNIEENIPFVEKIHDDLIDQNRYNKIENDNFIIESKKNIQINLMKNPMYYDRYILKIKNNNIYKIFIITEENKLELFDYEVKNKEEIYLLVGYIPMCYPKPIICYKIIFNNGSCIWAPTYLNNKIDSYIIAPNYYKKQGFKKHMMNL